MKFFIITFLILLAARIAAGYFVEAVPFFGSVLLPLTVLCVVFGILAALFTGLKIYDKFGKGKKE